MPLWHYALRLRFERAREGVGRVRVSERRMAIAYTAADSVISITSIPLEQTSYISLSNNTQCAMVEQLGSLENLHSTIRKQCFLLLNSSTYPICFIDEYLFAHTHTRQPIWYLPATKTNGHTNENIVRFNPNTLDNMHIIYIYIMWATRNYSQDKRIWQSNGMYQYIASIEHWPLCVAGSIWACHWAHV